MPKLHLLYLTSLLQQYFFSNSDSYATTFSNPACNPCMFKVKSDVPLNAAARLLSGEAARV